MGAAALASLTTAVVILTLPASSAARTQPVQDRGDSGKTTVKVAPEARKKAVTTAQEQQRLAKLAKHIGIARRTVWACQDQLGTTRTRASVSIWALPRSIPYRTWALSRWLARTKSCAKSLQQHSIPQTNDWVTAVNLVQRIYPGTKAWLLSCSSGESSWGEFVMNQQGSPAGGWMQMYESTYNSYNDTAFADARAKGFIISEEVNSWRHPIGQALTAAYMRTHGASANWDPSIDPACR